MKAQKALTGSITLLMTCGTLVGFTTPAQAASVSHAQLAAQANDQANSSEVQAQAQKIRSLQEGQKLTLEGANGTSVTGH